MFSSFPPQQSGAPRLCNGSRKQRSRDGTANFSSRRVSPGFGIRRCPLQCQIRETLKEWRGLTAASPGNCHPLPRMKNRHSTPRPLVDFRLRQLRAPGIYSPRQDTLPEQRFAPARTVPIWYSWSQVIPLYGGTGNMQRATSHGLRRGRRIQFLTVVWMSVEVIVALAAAWAARSPALLRWRFRFRLHSASRYQQRHQHPQAPTLAPAVRFYGCRLIISSGTRDALHPSAWNARGRIHAETRRSPFLSHTE